MYFDYTQYKQKGFSAILILLGMLIVSSGIIAGVYYIGSRKMVTVMPSSSPEATPPILKETPMPSTIYNCKSDTDCPAGQRCKSGSPECAPPPPGVHSGCESRCVIDEKCVTDGCSGELCLEEKLANQIASACLWREEYACYKSAKCEKQSDGKCGWTKTEELTKCLKEKTEASGSESYCHAFNDRNCPSNCEVGPSCPLCMDIGCHAKNAHNK